MAALLRATSNNEAFCSIVSSLWSSRAYWWVCRSQWKASLYLLYIQSFKWDPYMPETWESHRSEKLEKQLSAYLNSVVTVWETQHLCAMKPVWWTGYCWGMQGCEAWSMHVHHGGGLSACICWIRTLLWGVPSGMMDSLGTAHCSSEESAGVVWQCCLLKEQVEEAVEDGKWWREKQIGHLGAFPLAKNPIL